MTKKERFLAAFQGKPVDYVPVSMWKHVPEEFWANDDDFIKCQVDYYKATDVDFMKLSGDKYFAWPDPCLEGIEKAADLYNMKPLGADHPHIKDQIARTKRVVEAIHAVNPDDPCPCIYLLFVPISYIRLKIGYPMMMKLIREDPEAMKYACNVVAQDLKIFAKGMIEETGIDGFFYSVQNGEVNRFTDEEYRDWIMPSDRDVLDYINTLSDTNAIHFCAWEEVPNRLSTWADYHAPVISWSRYIDILDIQEAKKTFGTTVWGGFDNREGTILYTGTKEEIEAEVKSLIEQGGKTGYIIGSDCSLHPAMEEEHVRWVVEASRKFS